MLLNNVQVCSTAEGCAKPPPRLLYMSHTAWQADDSLQVGSANTTSRVMPDVACIHTTTVSAATALQPSDCCRCAAHARMRRQQTRGMQQALPPTPCHVVCISMTHHHQNLTRGWSAVTIWPCFTNTSSTYPSRDALTALRICCCVHGHGCVSERVKE